MTHCSPAELEARLRLHSLPDIGPQRFYKLLEVFGSASSALSAPAAAWRAIGMPQSSTEARRCDRVRDQALLTLRWAERKQQHLLLHDMPAYPALLKETAGAPPLLFVQGDPSILERPQIAIVGSRQAAQPSLDTARRFARSLAKGGFTVTSGLALGVDAAAHQGALDVEGVTIAVVGTGLDQMYPARHRGLAQAIIEQGGALVSELALRSAPHASHFPRRNRIISGLSLGVLVVEASPSSGSLITARLAAEQGREVYAIPGSIHAPGARGCHQLIRDGALLVECVDDILASLQGWQFTAPSVQPAVQQSLALQHPLLELLKVQPLGTDELVGLTELPLQEVLTTLTDFELEGNVVCEGGRWLYRA
ncbi:DNA-processing protein DprA [Denitrificimonas caeni]|uniref:DNA-processing protein DprA n=1 Tax=Denitrificimonas caeni TaxID=521720 RepID=UPI001962E0B4|nr:DNA-processing protein DprA [Denitrificimonas caeni]